MPPDNKHNANPDTTDGLCSIEHDLCLRSLPAFVRCAWRVLEPGVPLRWNWHLDVICSRLALVTEGRHPTDRIIINVPYGTMKSYLVSVFWPAWEWAHNPALGYNTASYSAELTTRDNLRVRNLITSEWYQSHFPHVKLAGDQATKTKYDTTAGGWRYASSVGGGFTGHHPDRILLDDLLKAKEIYASSGAKLKECIDWYRGSVTTRVARDPTIVLIMQRLHEEDISGFLLTQPGWEHLCFPMRYDPDHPHPCKFDRRTEPGELLWPSFWPESKVAKAETELPPHEVSGQLQQNPIPLAGGLFKREYFKIIEPDDVPDARYLLIGRGWDTAGTLNAGDYTSSTKMAIDTRTDRVYVLHNDVAQTDDVDTLMLQVAHEDGRDVIIREEREPGSGGVIKSRARLLSGFAYSGIPVNKNKPTRADPFRSHCARGDVYLVRGAWNTPFIDEFCAFPAGKHDDRVDSTSCIYNALIELVGKGKKKFGAWGGRHSKRGRVQTSTRKQGTRAR